MDMLKRTSIGFAGVAAVLVVLTLYSTACTGCSPKNEDVAGTGTFYCETDKATYYDMHYYPGTSQLLNTPWIKRVDKRTGRATWGPNMEQIISSEKVLWRIKPPKAKLTKIGRRYMSELPDEVHEKIMSLCDAGDQKAESENYDGACELYAKAWDLLPEPKCDWEAATWILVAIGDAHYNSGQYEKADEVFRQVVVQECPGAIENPFVRLRRGQCALELGNENVAGEELTAAFALAGDEIFDEEDPKYKTFLKSKLKPPPEGWSSENQQ